MPDGPLAMFSPTIALDKEQLVIAGTAAAAEKALSLTGAPAERRWSPTGEVRADEPSGCPGRLVLLNVADPRDTLPAMIENLPAIVQAFNAQLAQAAPAAGPAARNSRSAIDADKLPTAEQLRPLLFPASTAVSVDAQGITLLQREAIPSITSPTTSGVLVALLLAGRSVGARGGPPRPVRQQLQADPPGDAQLPFREQHVSRGTSPTTTASRS